MSWSIVLTDEQRAMRDEVRELVKGVPRQLVLDMDADRVELPREFLQEAGRRNLLGCRYPERYGGRGMDWVATCMVMEEVGTLGYVFACVFGVGAELVAAVQAAQEPEEGRADGFGLLFFFFSGLLESQLLRGLFRSSLLGGGLFRCHFFWRRAGRLGRFQVCQLLGDIVWFGRLRRLGLSGHDHLPHRIDHAARRRDGDGGLPQPVDAGCSGEHDRIGAV